MTSLALAAALEALDAGDAASATEILLSAQEDGHRPRRRHICGDCGAEYPWPGLLDRHHIVSGHGDQEEAA